MPLRGSLGEGEEPQGPELVPDPGSESPQEEGGGFGVQGRDWGCQWGAASGTTASCPREVPPGIKVFPSESTLPIRWPEYWSFSFSSSPSHQHSVLISFTYLLGLPGGPGPRKESACNAGDPSSIPGSGRSPGKGIATHSSILVWRIPWTEKPGGL